MWLLSGVDQHVVLQPSDGGEALAASFAFVRLFISVGRVVYLQALELEIGLAASWAFVKSSSFVVDRHVPLEDLFGFQQTFAHFTFIECVFFAVLHVVHFI